uniref:Uncharacterized protein LOC104218433 n=1 Tax=Nicotiana sylvestris TaxID=4096 RepID=A0A1U7VLJ5_NICSY|nr:PREDICTED: uncharacterized protein LOC104218433 [Nicotiana sylvestris]
MDGDKQLNIPILLGSGENDNLVLISDLADLQKESFRKIIKENEMESLAPLVHTLHT